MQFYRHVNVLVPGDTYDRLRKLSYEESRPVSVLVREGISLVLKKTVKYSPEALSCPQK